MRQTTRRLGVVCVLATFAASCSGGKKEDGGRGAPPPGSVKGITPGEYKRLVGGGTAARAPTAETGGMPATPDQKRYRREGELTGTGDADDFVVVAAHKNVEITFDWPRGDVDFWVKVLGRDETELGDFELDNGEIIELRGGGRFRVEIYSKEGGGRWTATYED